MLRLGFLGFRVLVIVLELIVPDEFLPCIKKDEILMIKEV